MAQNEAFEREKLARVAAEAERRTAADEAQRKFADIQQAAAAQLQQVLAEASQREDQLRWAHVMLSSHHRQMGRLLVDQFFTAHHKCNTSNK